MEPWAAMYLNAGFNVLCVTMRGYPGSDGDSVEGGESGMQERLPHFSQSETPLLLPVVFPRWGQLDMCSRPATYVMYMW
jgi:hypothetical protein